MDAPKLTFISVNRFAESIADSLDQAQNLFDSMSHGLGFMSVPNIYQIMGVEGVINMIVAHNTLAKMLGSEPIIINLGTNVAPAIVSGPDFTPGLIIANIGEIRDKTRTRLAGHIAFVKGATLDPYLYAADREHEQGYQQSAVLGLHKARAVLAAEISRLTKPV